MNVSSLRSEPKLVIGVVGGSHFINHMYLILLPPVFGLLLTEFDTSLATLGLAIGVMSLFSATFMLPFGHLSDNYSRALTLSVGLTVGTLGVFVTALSPSLAWVFVGQALVGIGIAAHHPAHFPLLSAASTEETRGRVFSTHDFSGQLGYAAAPLLVVGVLALSGATWRDALLVVGIVGGLYALASSTVLAFVDDAVTRPTASTTSAGPTNSTNSTDSTDSETSAAPTDREPAGGRLPVRRRVLARLRSLVASPAILALAFLAMFLAMIGWGLRSFVVVLLTQTYGFDLGSANAVLTLLFVLGALMSLVSGALTDRFSAKPIILVACAVVAIGTAAAATRVIPPLLAAACVVVAGISLSMSTTPRSRIADRLSKRGDLGTNFAIITVGVTLGGTIAPPLFGSLIEFGGFGLAFYSIAAVAVLAGIVVVGIFLRYGEVLSANSTASAAD